MSDVVLSNPTVVLRALHAVHAVATEDGGVPTTTLCLVYLRVSQIAECGVCVQASIRFAQRVGESMDRLVAVAAWRTSPHFTAPEGAALAMAEVLTRRSGRLDEVPDAVWNEAARYYDEPALAARILSIAAVNAANRLILNTRSVSSPSPGLRRA
jgi:AhpD family alkylhydroperoxidase